VNLHLRGVVLPDDVERDVFVTEGGTITFDDGAADARTVVGGGFLLPGLVDAHAHLTVGSDLEPVDDEGVRANASAQLDGGVLLVREPGAASHASAGLGLADGAPRLQTAGLWLAGPKRFFPGWAREVTDGELADGAGGAAGRRGRMGEGHR